LISVLDHVDQNRYENCRMLVPRAKTRANQTLTVQHFQEKYIVMFSRGKPFVGVRGAEGVAQAL